MCWGYVGGCVSDGGCGVEKDVLGAVLVVEGVRWKDMC